MNTQIEYGQCLKCNKTKGHHEWCPWNVSVKKKGTSAPMMYPPVPLQLSGPPVNQPSTMISTISCSMPTVAEKEIDPVQVVTYGPAGGYKDRNIQRLTMHFDLDQVKENPLGVSIQMQEKILDLFKSMIGK